MSLLATMKGWARRLKRELLAVWVAARDPRTPWSLRLLAMAVAAYALSPIDLIPDFIPVLGLLDDLLLVPLGLWLVLRLLPPAVLADARQRADTLAARPSGRAGLVLVVLCWLAMAAALVGWWWARR